MKHKRDRQRERKRDRQTDWWTERERGDRDRQTGRHISSDIQTEAENNSAHRLEDVHLGGAKNERLSQVDFCQDATNGPHVYLSTKLYAIMHL